jgi:hypothetical protein
MHDAALTTFLFLLFGGVCVAMVGWGLAAPARIYTYPFLAAATFLAFVVIPMLGLRNDIEIQADALNRALFMGSLCASMIWVGHCFVSSRSERPLMRFDLDRLHVGATALVVIGGIFFFMISRLPEAETMSRAWSGRPVAYLFFANTLKYGFAIAVLLFATHKTRWSLVLVCVASVFILERVIVWGRRGVTAEFVLIFLLGFWFIRGIAIPRVLMLALVVGASVALWSAGDYRSASLVDRQLTRERLTSIPFKENFARVLQSGSSETRNSVMMIDATMQLGAYDYGRFHWNGLVFNYVPAQWFGEEFKASLQFDIPDVALAYFTYVPHTGTTNIGITDAYRSFGYLGCVKFLLIALAMRWLYARAMSGDFAMQVCYMLILTPGLHAITHSTQSFLSPWVHMAIFLAPVLIWARTTAPAADHRMVSTAVA